MKKNKYMILVTVAVLMLSSCGTYTGTGAYVGASFGSIIGSNIGGISGGWRGSHTGSLIGMAGGAVIGAAIGAAADEAQQKRYEQRTGRDRNTSVNMPANQPDYQPDYVSNGGVDDRLYGFGEDFVIPDASEDLKIRNARLIDASHDGILMRGEEARVVFEVYNQSDKPVYNVQPSVTELTRNKHILISENVFVERIMPKEGIRYTAMIKADNRLKDGEVVIKIGVFQANKEIESQTQEFRLATRKR